MCEILNTSIFIATNNIVNKADFEQLIIDAIEKEQEKFQPLFDALIDRGKYRIQILDDSLVIC